MGRKRGSAFCRRGERGSGFTLIEVVVVLALIAALMAIAFPQFVRLYARARVAFERQDLERQLTELPEKVRSAGRPGVLADPATAPDAPSDAPQPLEGTPMALRLDPPDGWTVSVPNPIRYHFNGVCDGGEVTLALPPLSLRYVLAPPLCRPLLAGGS